MADTVTDRMIAGGWLDRLVDRMSNQLPENARARRQHFYNVQYEMRQESPWVSGRYGRQWADLARAAEQAVERADEMRRGGTPIHTPNQVPSADKRSMELASELQYHVLVVVRDPETGGTNRVRVVLNSQLGLNLQDLATTAASPAMISNWWSDSGRRGEIAPTDYTVVEVIPLGIVGRR